MIEIIKTLVSDYTFQTVVMGSALLGIISGLLGSFSVLKKQSLIGDGISHAALPGIAAAFLLTGNKSTEIMLAGAFASGLTATALIFFIIKNSVLKFDSVLALIMSVFFGLGLVLLTYVQKSPAASQAGLKNFIYGQASSLLERDLILMSICGLVVLLTVFLLWKELKLFAFDKNFGETMGFSGAKLNLTLSFLTVAAIIIGLQTVGVVLMSAMLIAPAVAARQWCGSLASMAALSAAFGALSGITGTAASSLIPQMPTGPAVVAAASVIACISLIFAPGRGIISKIIIRKRNKASLKTDSKERK